MFSRAKVSRDARSRDSDFDSSTGGNGTRGLTKSIPAVGSYLKAAVSEDPFTLAR